MAGVQAAVDVAEQGPPSTTSTSSNKKEYIGSGAGYFTSKFSISEESLIVPAVKRTKHLLIALLTLLKNKPYTLASLDIRIKVSRLSALYEPSEGPGQQTTIASMASVQAAAGVVELDPTSTTPNKSTNKFSPTKATVQTDYIGSGAGYFTSKFSISEESIKFISPRAIESVKSIPVKVGDVFTIADYGCADGGTSMPLMYACVKELKSLYGNDLEVHINYEDKPENDFKSLFYFIGGLLPAPSSFLADFPNVFVSATATNFYDQCFPSGFVNFGFCCFAAQWLSQKPCNLTKAVLHCLSEIPDERNEFHKQAEKDWERFLLMRARELSTGGRLAMIVPVNDVDCKSSVSNVEKTKDPVRNTQSFSPIYSALYKVWEGMAKDNIITEDELKEMTIPEYFRTYEELTKPFTSDESPVRKAGLTLISVEIKEFALPQKKILLETGDAKLAARHATEETCAWSNSMFLSTLDGQPYSPEQKKHILKEYFSRLEEELLSSPEYYLLLTLWNAFIIIEKS